MCKQRVVIKGKQIKRGRRSLRLGAAGRVTPVRADGREGREIRERKQLGDGQVNSQVCWFGALTPHRTAPNRRREAVLTGYSTGLG